MTLSTKALIVTISINDTQRKTLCIMYHYAVCHNLLYYAECHYAEFHYDIMMNVVILTVVMLTVVVPR
jgi:hypothetical protein